MVFLATDVFAILNLVALIADVLVKRRDDVVEVGELVRFALSLLAGRRIVKVVGTLEDEAQCLWHESYLIGLTPAEEVQGNLTNAIMLRHAVHASLPSVFCRFQTFVTFQCLQCMFFIARIFCSPLLGSFARFPCTSIRFTELHVRKTDSIVEVEVTTGCL